MVKLCSLTASRPAYCYCSCLLSGLREPIGLLLAGFALEGADKLHLVPREGNSMNQRLEASGLTVWVYKVATIVAWRPMHEYLWMDPHSDTIQRDNSERWKESFSSVLPSWLAFLILLLWMKVHLRWGGLLRAAYHTWTAAKVLCFLQTNSWWLDRIRGNAKWRDDYREHVYLFG